MSEPAQPDLHLLKEAADWALTLHYGAPDDAERHAFERWRQRSPTHEAAWQRAQTVFDSFAGIPDDAGRATLKTLRHDAGRRRSLRTLGALLVAAPVGWLTWRQAPWRQWMADVATATGERQSLALPDGSQLVLNTASAIDIAFSPTARRIHLIRGEILITTHPDPAPVSRPFLVDTPQGRIRALGTRFSVRRLDAATSRVAVFADAVEIHSPGGSPRIVQAGEQADFRVAGIVATQSVDASAALWERGMLLARNQRLADVLAEMARYRRGALRCHPAVADLRVSGAISLADTDAGLALLEQSLPLRVERITDYWVSVVAR